MERRTVLEARNLCRFFHSEGEETCALRGVDLEVRAGEMVAVVGPSGSGKSTLLACLAGTDEPDGGEVRILEQRVTRLPEQQRSAIRARYVGFLLQSDNLIDHLTVEENVLLPVHLTRRGKTNRHCGPPSSAVSSSNQRTRRATVSAGNWPRDPPE